MEEKKMVPASENDLENVSGGFKTGAGTVYTCPKCRKIFKQEELNGSDICPVCGAKLQKGLII